MRRLVVLVLLLMTVSGCGRLPFVATRYDNFTAYYNKFFNARKAFDRGLKSVEKFDTRIDRDRYLALFANPDAVSNSRDFQDAIKKSADVLREHPESKWVDDALLLIGKSYFYQRNYVGAEQKFLEVIGLKTALEDEARFWLARTLITSGNFEDAARLLTESLNREGVSRRWGAQMQLALGELYVHRSDWTSAAEALASGLELVRDNDLGSRAQFLLGQVYETSGEYEKAVEAFRQVERYRPLYELSFAAKLSAVRVQGSYVDEDAALRDLRRMERDDKHYQYRNELAYVRGRIYQMQGHPDDAFHVYDDILYDVDGDISRVRGRIHYALGELYRDAYRDYLTASAHFDTAATVLGSAAGAARGGVNAAAAAQLQHAPEAIADAAEQKATFASFSEVMYRINEMDSLLHLGSLDDEAFDEAILEIRRKLGRQMAEQRRELERQQASQAFQDVGAADALRSGTSVSAASAAGSEAGFLFHRDPMRVEEARLNFTRVWGERPFVPNWRRRQAVDAYLAAAEEDGSLSESVAEEILKAEDPLPVIDVSPIPRDSLSQVRMRARRAAASYELANVLFLAMERPDSAAVWYRMVIEDADDSTLTQRAYYALAEVQRSMGDEASARRLYENVVRISATNDLGRQVSRRIGLATTAQSGTDTLSLAAAAYDRAYHRWQIGNHRTALGAMFEVAVNYPDTEFAPKALMAAGAIYAEWAQREDLDLLGPIPVNLPDSLLNHVGLSTRRAPAAPDSLVGSPDPDASDDIVSVAEESLAATSAEGAHLPEMSGAVEEGEDEDDFPGSAPPPGAGLVSETEIAVAIDSLRALSPDADEVEMPADGTVTADVTRAAEGPAETHEEVPDEGVLVEDGEVPDSLRAQRMAAAVDSLFAEDYEPINLERLYASIASRYAESPFAERATRIGRALDERRKERQAVADSIARAEAEALAPFQPDSLMALSDSLGAVLDSALVLPSDSLEVALPDTVAAPDELEEPVDLRFRRRAERDRLLETERLASPVREAPGPSDPTDEPAGEPEEGPPDEEVPLEPGEESESPAPETPGNASRGGPSSPDQPPASAEPEEAENDVLDPVPDEEAPHEVLERVHP